MKREEIIIVDYDDNVLGTKYRDEIDYTKDIYRTTGIWIKDSTDRILIAQRSHSKPKDSGKWGPSVAGTVNYGETYEENAYKELEEELGVKDTVLVQGPKQYINSPRKQFYQWFVCTVDKPSDEFNFQKDEVEQLRWVSKKDLLLDVTNHPDKYVPFMKDALDLMFS